VALPAEIAGWLEQQHGPFVVRGAVGGGCVNAAAHVEFEGGDAFLKYNVRAPRRMFAAEATGLRDLRAATSTVRIPRVLDCWEGGGTGTTAPGCLLLEWLEPGAAGAGFWERLGHGLAELHRATAAQWGWHEAGFIGPLPQDNAPLGRWAEFWRARRLEPQLRRARDDGRRVGRDRDWESLWHRLPELLAPAEADGPSLLHGDLWSGNVLATAGAAGADPALVDPAVYRGPREVDLAMARLFGGFPRTFFEAYQESWPLERNGAAARRAAYQLYYLLVHVNLFGAGYLSRTEQALRSALAD
jgi:protein-ribulosamine 3-kinase